MTTAIQDRQNLGLSHFQYKAMAEALSNHCYMNQQGQLVKIAKVKRKKLKNLKTQIERSTLKMNSPIYQELLRRIKIQIQKGERRPRV